jgi:hypothetical protein
MGRFGQNYIRQSTWVAVKGLILSSKKELLITSRTGHGIAAKAAKKLGFQRWQTNLGRICQATHKESMCVGDKYLRK